MTNGQIWNMGRALYESAQREESLKRQLAAERERCDRLTEGTRHAMNAVLLLIAEHDNIRGNYDEASA